ncbi:oligosaccharide flippase family protein [Candidatus Bathyarchaeota archaeon]|nr:oligosaccharide flippase family protein [Candidatus Bathyarchaeota archaeon]
MVNLRDIATSSARGTLVLTIGRFASILTSAIGMILVARMLSPEEYGLYALSLVLPSAFMLFNDWGINQGLVKYIAQYRSEEKNSKIIGLSISGLLFKLLLGISLTALLFILAGFLAVNFQGRPELGGYIRLISILILFQTLRGAGFSILLGLEEMEARAIMDIIQGLVKGIVSPVLVWRGLGISGVLIGHLISYVASSIYGLLILPSFFSRYGYFESDNVEFKGNIFQLVSYGFPLFLGGFFGGAVNWFRGLLMSWYIADVLIGNFSVASRFTSLISVFTSSIGSTLFPTFSRFTFKEEEKKLKEAYKASVSYSSIFVVPIVIFVFFFSEHAIRILFSDKYELAPLLLRILLLPVLLVGFGSLSNINLLNSQGYTKTTLRISVLRSLALAISSAILVFYFGIIGYAVSLVLSSFISVFFSLFLLDKTHDIIPNLKHSLKVYMGSIFSVGTAALVSSFIENEFKSLFLGGTVFLLLYFLISPLIGILTLRDINILQTMFNEFPLFYPIVNFLLEIEEKLVNLTLN